MDTTRLTEAVSTLREYCEQVRFVMVARGYPEAMVFVSIDTSPDSGNYIGVYQNKTGRGALFYRRYEFGDALAHAEALPEQVVHTPDSIAATLGISPDGRLLPEDAPAMCDLCGEREATEGSHEDSPYPAPAAWLCEPCADKARDRAVERAMEG